MNATQFHKVAKALADPRRFEILKVIANAGESCCAAIAGEIPIAQPTISHHLKELANAGLIRARKQGQYCYYHLEADVLNGYIQELQQISLGDRLS